MKLNFTIITLVVTLAIPFLGMSQDIEFPDLDKSPMDAAHYPARSAFANYLDADDPDRTAKIKVQYSRPYKKGRNIFGELQKWGEEWRVGANEATEVTFYNAVEIGGVTVPRGTYTLFAELQPDHWIIKLSEQRFIAGTANRDTEQDILATKVMTSATPEVREQFTIGFQKVDEGMVNMLLEWDQTRATLPINLNAPSMAGEDKSPMDLAQYPSRSRFQNFLKPEEVDANQPKIRVVYSRPQMNGRTIFGELLKYGEMWRVGANQTTLVSFYEDVNIGGTDIKKGTYGLFAKVHEDNWELIVHKNTQSWGHPNHDEKDNIVTVTAKTEATPKTLEALSVTFDEKGGNQVDIVIGWENTMARLPVMIKSNVKAMTK